MSALAAEDAHRQQHKDAEPAASEPGSMRLVQTPLDGQSKGVQRERFRKAVGDDAQPEPSLMDRIIARTKPAAPIAEAEPVAISALQRYMSKGKP